MIGSLVRQELQIKYRGSILGILWSLVNPVVMLAIYTFVFAVIFKARWNDPEAGDGRAGFALMLFAGFIVYSLFADCMNRAPGLVLANTNLVKRVVFPLEIQAWASLSVNLVQFAINLGVLLVAMLIAGSLPGAKAFLLPLVVAPFCLLLVGLAWMVSALAVYTRDIAQLVGHLVTILMFVSPVFYPVSAVPEPYRWLFSFNPLSYPIETSRALLLLDRAPDLSNLGVFALASVGVAWIGFWSFQQLRRGFADVV